MKHMAQNGFKALTSAWVLALVATVAWSQSLTWLGTLGGDWSEAFGVSADGSVVVGVAQNAAGYDRAFRWTAEGGWKTEPHLCQPANQRLVASGGIRHLPR
jgi:probable HAF family extracellular repeat protein